jgi:aspartate aminotransferase/aminotransferase
MPTFSRVVTDAEEAMSIKYNTMVYDLQRQGVQVLVMSLGEAFFDIPLLPMDDLPYPAVNHYSNSRGIPELRQRLASYFAAEYAVDFDPDSEILITAGSKAAIHMTLMSILDPGDEVLFSEPGWVSYPEQIKLCYGVPVSMPFDHSVSDYERHITERTRAIIVTSPHNPRGLVLSEGELRDLVELARKHDLWLLSDEAYSDFLLDGSFVSAGRLDPSKERVIIFNSMSKNFGISGWRLGYVIANKQMINRVLTVNQHLITCPATILEYYLARHFDSLLEITKPQIRRVVEVREHLARYMSEIGLSALPGGATFYFFVSLGDSELRSEEFATRLLYEQHISVVPGVGYGASCDSFVRVSIGTASLEENMRGIAAIKALIDATS